MVAERGFVGLTTFHALRELQLLLAGLGRRG
jgi:hypothetical protein